MNALFSASYLLVCALLATELTRGLTRQPVSNENVSRFLAWVVVFFAAFFGGFYILGYVNLATNLPTVDPAYGCVIVLIALVGFRLWFAKRMPGLLNFKRDAIYLQNPLRISLPGTGLTRTLAIITLATFCLIALMLVLGFPRGYEAQAYHLPIALHIFQTQSLKLWNRDTWYTYPANGSTYFGFLLSFIPEHLVAIAGLMLLIPLVTGVYGLGRATGADKTASLLASLGLLTIPIVSFPAFEAEADVGGITFLTIAVYFAIAKSDHPVSYMILCGLAAGLAFGFKSLHLVSIAFLLVLFLLRAWDRSQKDTSPRSAQSVAAPALVFIVCTLITSGFWMVRNYVQMGNPLYPVHFPMFDIFGWTKALDLDFTKRHYNQLVWVRSSIEWFVYPWVEWHYRGENFKSSAGLGAFFASMVPVACLASLIGVIKKEREEWSLLALFLSGGVFVLIVWWILDDRQPRYALGALPFLIPLVAWTISQTEGWTRKVYELIAALCILSMLFVIFSKQLVEVGASFIYAKQFARHAFYLYPEMLDRLPPGSTVMNFARRPLNYALYGEKHQNRVISYTETCRLLEAQVCHEEAPDGGYLAYSTLHTLGATHIVTEGYPSLSLDECVRLQKIDQMERHPIIGTLLPKPFTLYEIKYCDTEVRMRKR